MKETENIQSYPAYPTYPVEENMNPTDYIDIIKRRKLSLIIPAVAVFLLAVAVALLLPSIYRSEATILIEEQEVPEDFVRAPVASYAEQRLQMIHQRIMSSVRLKEIIDRFDLYRDMRDKLTSEEIIEKMRDHTLMAPISVEVMDRRTGRPGMATIAFSLAYEGKGSPTKIQQVANRLTSLFLDENLRVRVRQTEETAKFLEDEAKRVKHSLDEIESAIAIYKKKHISVLPELLSVNLQALNDIERRIDVLNEQLKSQKEREGYLQTQLANVSPDITADSEDKLRLHELKGQLVHLQTKFSDSYPDVIKTKVEIAMLEKQMAQRSKDGPNSSNTPDNPAYITLASQLSSTRADINSIHQQIRDLKKKEEKYQQRVETTPIVEEKYRALLQNRDTTQAKYDDLTAKLMEAKVSHGLEKEQKGERFTLIDPPKLPEKPYKPNRLAIILIGFVLGIGSGVGTAAAREFMDDTARCADDLIKAGLGPVLGGIPVLETGKEKQRSMISRYFVAAGVVFLCVFGVIVFHYFVIDLDLFWVKVMRKVTMVFG
jgi:polysaccharide chain length determinant protein (PEP-CTERM system associated)